MGNCCSCSCASGRKQLSVKRQILQKNIHEDLNRSEPGVVSESSNAGMLVTQTKVVFNVPHTRAEFRVQSTPERRLINGTSYQRNANAFQQSSLLPLCVFKSLTPRDGKCTPLSDSSADLSRDALQASYCLEIAEGEHDIQLDAATKNLYIEEEFTQEQQQDSRLYFALKPANYDTEHLEDYIRTENDLNNDKMNHISSTFEKDENKKGVRTTQSSIIYNSAAVQHEQSINGSHSTEGQSPFEIHRLLLEAMHGLCCFNLNIPVEKEIYLQIRPLIDSLLQYLNENMDSLTDTSEINIISNDLTQLINNLDEVMNCQKSYLLSSELCSLTKRVCDHLHQLCNEQEKLMLQSALNLLYQPNEWRNISQYTELAYADEATRNICYALHEIHYITPPSMVIGANSDLDNRVILQIKDRITQQYRSLLTTIRDSDVESERDSIPLLRLKPDDAIAVQYVLLGRLTALTAERPKIEKQSDLTFFNRCIEAESQWKILRPLSLSPINEGSIPENVDSDTKLSSSSTVVDQETQIDPVIFSATDEHQNCYDIDRSVTIDNLQTSGRTGVSTVDSNTEKVSVSALEEVVSMDSAKLNQIATYLHLKRLETAMSVSRTNPELHEGLKELLFTIDEYRDSNTTKNHLIPKSTLSSLKVFLASQNETYARILDSSLPFCNMQAGTHVSDTAAKNDTVHADPTSGEDKVLHEVIISSDIRPAFQGKPCASTDIEFTLQSRRDTQQPVKSMQESMDRNANELVSLENNGQDLPSLSETIAQSPAVSGSTDSLNVKISSICNLPVSDGVGFKSSTHEAPTPDTTTKTPPPDCQSHQMDFSIVVASLNCLKLLKTALSNDRQLFDLELKLIHSSLLEVYQYYGEALTNCTGFRKCWHEFIGQLTTIDPVNKNVFRRIDWKLIEWTIDKIEQLPTYLDTLQNSSFKFAHILGAGEAELILPDAKQFCGILCTQILQKCFSTSQLSFATLSVSLAVMHRLLTSIEQPTLYSFEINRLKQLTGNDLSQENLQFFNMAELLIWKTLQWWSLAIRLSDEKLEHSYILLQALATILYILGTQSDTNLKPTLLCIWAHCVMTLGTLSSKGVTEFEGGLINEWMSPLDSLIREFKGTTSAVCVLDTLRSISRIFRVNNAENVDRQELSKLCQGLRNSAFYLEDQLSAPRFDALVSTLDTLDGFILHGDNQDLKLVPETLREIVLHAIRTMSTSTKENYRYGNRIIKTYIYTLQLKSILWRKGSWISDVNGLLLTPKECATVRACLMLFSNNCISSSSTDYWLGKCLSLGCFYTVGMYLNQQTCMHLLALADVVIGGLDRGLDAKNDPEMVSDIVISN